MNPKSSNSCKRQRERVAQIRERFILRITREFEQNFGATSLLREFKRYLLLTTSFVLANFLLKKLSLFLGRVLCCSVVDRAEIRGSWGIRFFFFPTFMTRSITYFFIPLPCSKFTTFLFKNDSKTRAEKVRCSQSEFHREAGIPVCKSGIVTKF